MQKDKIEYKPKENNNFSSKSLPDIDLSFEEKYYLKQICLNDDVGPYHSKIKYRYPEILRHNRIMLSVGAKMNLSNVVLKNVIQEGIRKNILKPNDYLEIYEKAAILPTTKKIINHFKKIENRGPNLSVFEILQDHNLTIKNNLIKTLFINGAGKTFVILSSKERSILERISEGKTRIQIINEFNLKEKRQYGNIIDLIVTKLKANNVIIASKRAIILESIAVHPDVAFDRKTMFMDYHQKIVDKLQNNFEDEILLSSEIYHLVWQFTAFYNLAFLLP